MSSWCEHHDGENGFEGEAVGGGEVVATLGTGGVELGQWRRRYQRSSTPRGRRGARTSARAGHRRMTMGLEGRGWTGGAEEPERV
eukprot:3675668-Rhodomonas_salina.1